MTLPCMPTTEIYSIIAESTGVCNGKYVKSPIHAPFDKKDERGIM